MRNNFQQPEDMEQIKMLLEKLILDNWEVTVVSDQMPYPRYTVSKEQTDIEPLLFIVNAHVGPHLIMQRDTMGKDGCIVGAEEAHVALWYDRHIIRTNDNPVIRSCSPNISSIVQSGRQQHNDNKVKI